MSLSEHDIDLDRKEYERLVRSFLQNIEGVPRWEQEENLLDLIYNHSKKVYADAYNDGKSDRLEESEED